jgi:D-3-phosphoglycerate dehydrogenase
MVKLALAGDFVPFAVNVSAAEANETLRPYLPLAERLGGLFASLVGQLPKQLEITAEGEIGQYDNRILTLSVLKGFFGSISDEPVSYVNAPQMAKNAGLEIRETSSRDSRNFVNLITLRCEGHSISATLTGRNGEPRLVMIDDHATDVPPAENMLVVRNDDRPGVIGVVGTVLGNAGVNINDMGVGRSSVAGSALMVIASSGPAPDEVLAALRAAPGITSVHVLTA